MPIARPCMAMAHLHLLQTSDVGEGFHTHRHTQQKVTLVFARPRLTLRILKKSKNKINETNNQKQHKSKKQKTQMKQQ